MRTITLLFFVFLGREEKRRVGLVKRKEEKGSGFVYGVVRFLSCANGVGNGGVFRLFSRSTSFQIPG